MSDELQLDWHYIAEEIQQQRDNGPSTVGEAGKSPLASFRIREGHGDHSLMSQALYSWRVLPLFLGWWEAGRGGGGTIRSFQSDIYIYVFFYMYSVRGKLVEKCAAADQPQRSFKRGRSGRDIAYGS